MSAVQKEIEKKDISKDTKKNKKVLRMGLYSLGMSVIAVCIVIGINLFVSSLPSDKVKFDMTPEDIYSLSEQSVQIAEAVDEELTFYLLASETGKDNSLYEFLKRYQAENKNIKIELKDPVLYPNFATDYTDEDVVTNSVIVVSEKRGRYISYNDIYVSETSIDYSTYQYVTETSFDGENCITSAIDYVSSDELPVVYTLTGHGEQSISNYSTSLEGVIESENIDYQELSLIKEGAVPQDASAVLIFAPSKDITEDELEMLRAYAQTDGKFYVLTEYVEEDMVNLKALLADFGMQVVDGIVLENDREYYYQAQSYLLPDILSHEITKPLMSNYYVMMVNAQAVEEVDDLADNISVTSLLMTSDEAYSKIAGYDMDTYNKESGDIDGPFYLAAASVVSGDDYESKMLYIPSVAFLADQINQVVSGSNHDFFLNGLSWLCEKEDSISIRAKSLDVEYLTIDEATALRLQILFIGIVPIAILSFGGIVIYQRKRRG